ncbi:hypothetical protein BOTBODRAFT_184697 [Botryobasidium botryosum FD-172 SS1]|uniref:Uncharacterized protein n=1 Tax=Botryobasidium botryosum (strain FD-172 SS1) TaxID=930990 RepID=A0A067MVZ3_BOTB1|nr:hypothetical protein BOTBODRAFT_184697 [Botryobasidium botryosum FD-172 SS1]
MVARSLLELELSGQSLYLLDELISSLRTDNHTPANNSEQDARRRLIAYRKRSELVSEVFLSEVARVRAQCNQLTPIHILPVEILTQIFLLGATDDIRSFKSFPRFSTAISHVCQLWRDVSLSTPSLWTLFRPGLPRGLASRAKSVPRDLIAWHDPQNSPDVTPIRSSLSNMRSLRIVLPHNKTSFDLTPYMLGSAPNLSSLHISVKIVDRRFNECVGEIPTRPFEGRHHLLDVSISRCAIRWDSALFTRLRRLRLRRIPSTRRIRVRELLEILRACPDLEDLSLIKCGFQGDDSGEPLSTAMLPRLRNVLLISQRFIGTQGTLLSPVLAPESANINVRCSVIQNMDDLFRESLQTASPSNPSLLPLLETALSRCRRLTLGRVIAFGEIKFDILGDGITLSLGLGDQRVRQELEKLVSYLVRAPEIECLTVASMGASFAASLIRILRQLPRLRQLVFDTCWAECEDMIFSALADANWLHGIEEITLERSMGHHGPLLRLIQSRAFNAELTPIRKVTILNYEGDDSEGLGTLETYVDEFVHQQ